MQGSGESQRTIIVDASVLINFLKIGRLDLLKRLPGYGFRIPEEVYREVSDVSQRRVLDLALQEGWIEQISFSEIEELRAYDQYRRQMDAGEAACLAVAVCRRWILACDESRKKRVYREVQEKLGAGHLLNTPGVLVKLIQAGLLDVQEADLIKEELARNRFRMTFSSFQDLLDKE